MNQSPYLNIVGMPREMAGKGAPSSTVFGILGHTKGDSYMKTLGGLVAHAPTERIQKGTVKHVAGKAPKTHIPKAHYGQVPYAGYYMSAEGDKL